MDYEVKGRNVAERAANNRGSRAAVGVLTVVLVVALTMRNELLLMALPLWATLSTLARFFLLLLGVLCAVGFFATLFGLVFGCKPADSTAYQAGTLVNPDDDGSSPHPRWDPMAAGRSWTEGDLCAVDVMGRPMGMHAGQIEG